MDDNRIKLVVSLAEKFKQGTDPNKAKRTENILLPLISDVAQHPQLKPLLEKQTPRLLKQFQQIHLDWVKHRTKSKSNDREYLP